MRRAPPDRGNPDGLSDDEWRHFLCRDGWYHRGTRVPVGGPVWVALRKRNAPTTGGNGRSDAQRSAGEGHNARASPRPEPAPRRVLPQDP